MAIQHSAITIILPYMQLGLMALVLPILGAVSFIGATASVGLTTSLITLFITVPCIPCPQLIVSCVELGMLLARICSKKIPEEFLVWVSITLGFTQSTQQQKIKPYQS